MYKKLLVIHLMMMTFLMNVSAQSVGIKTSATMLFTMTPNIEVNFPVSRRMTAHVPVLYNPFKFGDNTRIQQLTIMPGLRFWGQERYIKQFYSVYGIASRYHFGGLLDMKYRYSGKAFGGGIGVGYSWLLSNRFNVEVEAGIGIVYTTYDKYGWKKNSRYYGEYSELHVIPTKLDLNLVYLF